MARTPSTMQELGTSAPTFTLPEPRTGKTIQLSDFQGSPLLVVFACNHCPFVIHIIDAFQDFASEYQARGLSIVMINANDVEHYPDDSPEKMISFAESHGLSFHYLYDESQQVAKQYRAACTPDFFLYDERHVLVYRGQFDAARPGNEQPVNGVDLREASDALLQGAAIAMDQTPSLGCNIKWKAGNEPDYF